MRRAYGRRSLSVMSSGPARAHAPLVDGAGNDFNERLGEQRRRRTIRAASACVVSERVARPARSRVRILRTRARRSRRALLRTRMSGCSAAQSTEPAMSRDSNAVAVTSSTLAVLLSGAPYLCSRGEGQFPASGGPVQSCWRAARPVSCSARSHPQRAPAVSQVRIWKMGVRRD